MPVWQLEMTMPPGELVEWIAYSNIEKWGPEIDDYRAALGISVYMNAHRDRDSDPIPPLAYFPWHERPEPPPPTPEQAAENVLGFFKTIATPEGKQDV